MLLIDINLVVELTLEPHWNHWNLPILWFHRFHRGSDIGSRAKSFVLLQSSKVPLFRRSPVQKQDPFLAGGVDENPRRDAEVLFSHHLAVSVSKPTLGQKT